MYDFYLGSAEEIAQDEAKYLIAIKRMMPRWINSLPDSEFLALAALLDAQGSANKGDLVVVETGVGASTLACIFYAMKYDGLALSWDLNSEKGSAVRTVCTETMASGYFGKAVNNHWKLVPYNSLSPYAGLPVLNQVVDHVDLFFHDSEHVWQTVSGELMAVLPMLRDGAVVALDDANQDFLHTNIAYVNTVRKKIDLPPVASPTDNKVDPFYLQAERLLLDHWKTVEHLPDIYKERFQSDPYFSYFDAEFNINTELETVRKDQLEHRFDSWRLTDRK